MKKVNYYLSTGKRKVGAAILCCAVIISLSTGMSFAENANNTAKSEKAAQYANSTRISIEEQAKADQRHKKEKSQYYLEYVNFGMTYDMEQDLFLYDGKVVRRFYDCVEGRGFTNSYGTINYADYDKSVDLTAIHDTNGKLIGLSAASKEEFENRTIRIEQSRKQIEQIKNQNAAISYSTDNSSSSAETYQNNQTISEVSWQMDEAKSYNTNFVDTTLNGYLNYGIYYDKENNEWVFNKKVIALFIDTGHQIFVNLPADDTGGDYTKAVTDSNGAFLRVIRKSDGSIDNIVEMGIEEAAKTLNTMFIS